MSQRKVFLIAAQSGRNLSDYLINAWIKNQNVGSILDARNLGRSKKSQRSWVYILLSATCFGLILALTILMDEELVSTLSRILFMSAYLSILAVMFFVFRHSVNYIRHWRVFNEFRRDYCRLAALHNQAFDFLRLIDESQANELRDTTISNLIKILAEREKGSWNTVNSYQEAQPARQKFIESLNLLSRFGLIDSKTPLRGYFKQAGLA